MAAQTTFVTSKNTADFVEYLRTLPFDTVISFAKAASDLGFHVESSTPSYRTAIKIARRDHDVVIAGVRKVGFKRLSGVETVGHVKGRVHRIHRASKLATRELTISLTFNLPRGTYLEATGDLARLRVIEGASARTRAKTNGREKPE